MHSCIQSQGVIHPPPAHTTPSHPAKSSCHPFFHPMKIFLDLPPIYCNFTTLIPEVLGRAWWSRVQCSTVQYPVYILIITIFEHVLFSLMKRGKIKAAL